VKRIRLQPAVQAQVRSIPKSIVLTILEAIHRYAETGIGEIRPLAGEFEGFMRLRVGDYRVFFTETADTVAVHRVANRREAYR